MNLKRLHWLAFFLGGLSGLHGVAFAAPAAAPASAKAQQELSRKDPCYGWFYATTLRFRNVQGEVIRASESQSPCAPAIDKFRNEMAPIPESCAQLKLRATAPLLKTQLKEQAANWNKRGWQHWDVQPENKLPVEFGKVRDFYLRELQSGCDTRK